MINRYAYRSVEWIDLVSPTYEEIISVAKEFGLNRVLAEELAEPSPKPKVDLYHEYLFLILHFPAIRHTHNGSGKQEIDFIIGENFIITAHYETIDPIHEFSKVFEVNAILDRSDMGEHAGFVFYHMLRHIYKATGNEIESLKERLGTIQTGTFSGKEREMVTSISSLGRDLLTIKGILRTHRQALDSISAASVRFFGEDFTYPMRSITNEYYRIENEILHANELLAELRETNNSLLSTRQNEVMKTLTIMAFVMFPLSLIATIFGMNTSYLPIIGHKFDFWIIMAIMAGLTGLFFLHFKFKKWL